MSTITKGLQVQAGKVSFSAAGQDSYFRVDGHVDVAFEAIRNPVTGAEHPASILLPTGMINQREDAYSVHHFSATADGLEFSYAHRNALSSVATWQGP
jgi:hypothetical protein